ncbi:MAG: alpha/beta hydrolase [Gemmatimonadaceae bacterium]|nr:alpha/beta hydrolase [Gemmatimonadaceae bacterium]
MTALCQPPVGEYVTVGDRRLLVHRRGTEGPTIVFLPGAGTVGIDYWSAFEGASALSTCILYDRAGTGWSDDAPLPRTADQVTDELYALLNALDGESGGASPVLLVGHSLGGGYAQHFARRFPGRVCALLLLDPAHQDYPSYEPPAIAAAAAAAAAESASATGDAVAEWVPPAELLQGFAALFAEKFAAYPPAIRDAAIDYHTKRWRTGLLESSNAHALYAQFAEAPPLPDVPLVVLTALALDAGARFFMSDALQQEVIDGKARLNAFIAASVPRGAERVLPDASHSFMAAERADAVAAAIGDLLAHVTRA